MKRLNVDHRYRISPSHAGLGRPSGAADLPIKLLSGKLKMSSFFLWVN